MGYDVQIRRIGIEAVIDLQGQAVDIAAWVKGEPPAFPDSANRFNERDGMRLCWVAPQRWLLRAPIDQEASLLEMTQPSAAPLEISIVQVSDTLCFFDISGPEAGEIISIACSLDHHPSVFPDHAVSYTNVFGIKGLLFRNNSGFEIAAESSFADMLEDYLARANA